MQVQTPTATSVHHSLTSLAKQPVLKSTDPSKDARIKARKQRIEATRQSKQKPDKTEGSSRKIKLVEEKKESGRSKTQISASTKKIESTRILTTEQVTSIRVGIVNRESNRRAEVARKDVQVWQKKKSEEVYKSGLMRADIISAWDSILKITRNDPYELNTLLGKQMQACEDLLANKNKLLNEYITELKIRDDDYVKELKRQSEEIDLLLERMETQYKSLHLTLRSELDAIEKSFIEERSELIQTQIKELESLVSSRRENEGKYMLERSDRIEDHIKQLEVLRIRDAEEYNLVKIKLETDVQVLEQQLQQMRATYQLNTEKLEYNFQVLKKREEENATILGTQKRKITRLTDHLNLIKQKLIKQEKAQHTDTTTLTEDYKRITDQFKCLSKKFSHFQVSDTRRVEEVQVMARERTEELARKVMEADKIIWEQQLGSTWTWPDFFTQTQKKEKTRHRESLAKLVTAPPQDKQLTHLLESSNTKKMLQLLCDEAGFLVEEKLTKLLSPLDKDDASLMKLDSIFKAVGVETVDEVEQLMKYFVKSGIEEDKEVHQMQFIHPDEVVRAIRKFVEDQNSKTKEYISPNAENAPKEVQNDSSYWDQIANVIDDKGYRIWMAVYAAMKKYNHILMERHGLMESMQEIHRQNEELKMVLRQYMAAKVNDELQVPPTEILWHAAGGNVVQDL